MSRKSKSNAKIWAVFGVMVVAVALVGAGVYLYMNQEAEISASRITTLQKQATTTTVGSSAYLALTATWPIDFEGEIDANGEVPTSATDDPVTGTPILTIANDDISDPATGVYVMLYDPVSGAEGLPDVLEDTTMSIYAVFNGVTTPLYLNTNGVGAYTSGVYIGNLAVGASTSITFSGYVDATGVEDTYNDATDYTLTFYVYQTSGADSTPITFELNT